MKVAVFGAGTMGSGIAQVFAAKGHTALMYASSTASAQRHKDKLAASLNKKVARGKMTQEAADDIMSRVLVEEFEAAADADLVIECVAENMEVKKELLGRLDALCKDETIFASNTSSISITAIAAATKRPQQVLGMHFFNPAPVMKLIEVIAGYNTSEETVRRWIRSGKLKANMNSRKKGSVITDAMLREFTKNTPKYAAALTTPIGGIVAASTLLLGTLVAKNVEKGEAIKNSTIDSEEIKKILKENLATVKINIKNKKKAIAQLEQEIVDEETKIKSLEYLLKNIENAKGDINE